MADTPKPITFVLSDESVNAYGYRILTQGINLSLFAKNPLMLYNHHRTIMGKTDEILPIGRWENIRIEDNKLLADAVFDQTDDFALKIKNKVEGRFLNMASVYMEPITTSEEPELLIQGQTRPTVIECLLKEASICDIPGNRNAVRLCDSLGNEIKLSDNDNNHLLPLLSTNQKENKMNLKDVTTALGLSDGADESTVLLAINQKLTENKTLKAENEAYRTAETERQRAERDTYLSDAVKARKITQSQVAHYEALYDANAESTRAIVDALPSVKNLSQVGADASDEPKLSPLERRKTEVANKLKNQ